MSEVKRFGSRMFHLLFSLTSQWFFEYAEKNFQDFLSLQWQLNVIAVHYFLHVAFLIIKSISKANNFLDPPKCILLYLP